MHSAFALHHFPGADAKHHVMRVMIVAAQEMNIVRRDQTDTEVLGDFRQHRVAPFLLLHPVIVELDEEILRAEDVAILRCGLGRLLNVVRLDGGVHFPSQTSTQADQA